MLVNLKIASRVSKAVLGLCLFLSLAGIGQVFPQPPSSTPSGISSEDPKKIDSLAEEQREFIRRLDKKDAELAELRIKFETTTSNLTNFAGFLGLLLTIGTGFSIYGFIRSEKRATEAHSFSLSSARDSEQRAVQGFGLALIGETANQKRAAEVHENFLSGSKETLELVNATLTLAKEASERAAKMIERRARAIVDELDRESQFLLASVPAQDDRALIANPTSRSNLRSVAHKITGFEINRFILPEDIQLTPPCLFIRGMDFHLGQQFEDAITSWQNVALSPSASDNLKSLAWYWIGYEQNNLNRFDDAEQSFENALKSATGERRYELQRILIETKFFNKNKKNYRSDAAIQPFENLLLTIQADDPSEELEARKTKILITLGNVISQTGRELRKKSREAEAIDMFRRAKTLYEQVAERDKWALFGFAEMLYELEEVEKAQEIFANRVRDAAIDESVRREEPRTKVLARTTELICCLCVPRLNIEAPGIRSLVLQELGRVDERLTVYSQVQKRNVTKAEFQDDLDELMKTLLPNADKDSIPAS
jgi:tetratricopeptide (TPR) repeat protein